MSEFKYKSEVIGKNGIVARVVAKSKSAYSGQEIVTWEVEHHRWILAEINKHRMLSNNYQSSRAVPVAKIIEQVRNNPATPVFWGKNQTGMQATEECNEPVIWDDAEFERDRMWECTAIDAAYTASCWDKAKYHKQIVNRLLEPFMMVKGVITATDFDNFFHLRLHKDAQPELQELARCMWEAYELAEAEVLYEGEWHTPYVEHFRASDGDAFLEYHSGNLGVTLEQAKKTSAAACAQVSFRKLDLSEETVERVYARLIDTEQPHSACMEHQATPLKLTFDNVNSFDFSKYPEGITHLDKAATAWSGNFRNWIQNRKLIPNESCTRFHLRDEENK